MSFFRDVCHLKLPEDVEERAQAYEDLCSSAGWFWCHKDFVIACERPKVISRDEAGRLHRTDGPAVEYRDGWGVYAINGVRVPAEVVLSPQTLGAARITAETNGEVRRVMLERYGLKRYLEEVGAKELDRSSFGVLYRHEVQGEVIVSVVVENPGVEPDGSHRTYAIPCNSELRPLLDTAGGVGEPQAMTARNAVASLVGLRGEEYEPMVES